MARSAGPAAADEWAGLLLAVGARLVAREVDEAEVSPHERLDSRGLDGRIEGVQDASDQAEMGRANERRVLDSRSTEWAWTHCYALSAGLTLKARLESEAVEEAQDLAGRLSDVRCSLTGARQHLAPPPARLLDRLDGRGAAKLEGVDEYLCEEPKPPGFVVQCSRHE